MDNLFVTAARNKTRWPSSKGDLTVEQLWDLPLTSERGVSLDSIAISVNSELKGITDESFVSSKPNARHSLLSFQLEVLKYIIGVRKDESSAAKVALSNRNERDRLLAIVAQRANQAEENLSDEAIQQRLKELG